jgi:hypothetical protein
MRILGDRRHHGGRASIDCRPDPSGDLSGGTRIVADDLGVKRHQIIDRPGAPDDPHRALRLR